MVHSMPLSPLQERISELCSRVVTITDPYEFEQVISELRAELRRQLARLKTMVSDAKETISQLPPESFSDRRKTDRRKTERRKRRLVSVG